MKSLLAGFLACCGLVWGQGGLAAVTGTVVDSSSSAVPNATVKIVQTSTNAARTVTTNETGLFTLPSLSPSEYTITITATGFKEKNSIRSPSTPSKR